MLQEIIGLFKARKIISVKDIAIHFDKDRDTIKPMLNQLERKKYIEKVPLDCKSCSGKDCGTCPFLPDTEFYRLVES